MMVCAEVWEKSALILAQSAFSALTETVKSFAGSKLNLIAERLLAKFAYDSGAAFNLFIGKCPSKR